MNKNTTLFYGYFFALLAVLIWSGFNIVSRMGGKGALTAYDITALRFGVCGLLMLPVFFWRGGIGQLTIGRLAFLVSFAGVGYALFAYSGFRFAPAAHAAILLPGTLQFLTVIATWLLIRETPDGRRRVSLGLIAAGIGCIGIQTLAAPAQPGPYGPVWIGDLLFLAASSCWATFTVLLRKWKVEPWDATVGVAVGSMAAYLPVYLLFLPKAIGIAPWSEILLQGFYQGVLAAIAAMIFYTQAAKWIGATALATLMALAPALTALLAVPLLDEPLTLFVMAGVGLVTAGAFVGARR